jgi:non-homologous end joining protein Ku
LKALDVESSKVIDLEKFVPRGDIDTITSIPIARSPWRRRG